MTQTARDQQNEIVLATMRKHHGSGWWAAAPLAAECREALGFLRYTAARVVVDRTLRRLRYRDLVESSGGGLWRAKP